MHSIIYRSVAHESVNKVNVYKMLDKAKSFNAANNITGCLLYHNNVFLQLIEGEKDVVTSLYNKIDIDERHTNVKLLLSEEIDERIFSKWDMAFQDLGEEAFYKVHKMEKLQKLFEESSLYTKTSELGMILFKSVLDILHN